MSPLLQDVSSQLLPVLNGKNTHQKWKDCANKYPWYATPWLMLATEKDNEPAQQKVALWFANEQRLHWLLTAQPLENDGWLAAQLNAVEKSEEPVTQKATAEIPASEVPAIAPAVTETIPFLDQKKVDKIEEVDVKTAFAQINKAETDEEVAANNTDAVIEKEASDKIEEKLKRPIPPLILSARPAKNDMLFEPFYAVDYFASQGIKLEQGETQNKVDKQVKSFTQWLKTMKQVNFKPDENKANDPKVDAQAQASIVEKEVITEAMADVLEKQGKYKKAAEIYQKLILLHPEKTTYFAARLTDLKDKQ